MKVIIFGATGMVGQGVLRECLLAPDVTLVQTIGRTPTGQQHAKLRELTHAQMLDFSAIEDQLSGFDACFFCLGVTSAKMSEASYIRITHDITLAAATALTHASPDAVFVYVSALGADSSETGPIMWERVRGKTENALFRVPLREVAVFRPGMIQPLDGIKSKTPAYRMFYAIMKPLLPLLRAALPRHVLTTRQIGQAMLAIARKGAPKKILEVADIAALSQPKD